MRILFVSGELIGSALCRKLVLEGNDVKLYIHNEDWKRCLDGIVPKTENWRNELNWVTKDGLIVFDDVIFGEEQEWLRHFGYKVVGGCQKGDLLEVDRRYFQEVAKEYGVNTLPSYNFLSPQAAYDFVENNRSRWVVKQNTHVSSLNFVGQSKDGEDVLRVLKEYKKRRISTVHLQQYAEGVEVGVARYFNGNDWVGPIEVNHEHKKLEDGDIGPLTPEMGTVLWYTESEIPLFTETLGKLKEYLKKINFKGDIDINCIINGKTVMPLEATPRFGAPSTEIQVALHKSPWNDFLSAIAKGEKYDLDYRKGYGIAVSVAVPPFPYPPDKLSRLRVSQESRPIVLDESLLDDDLEHIQFEEVSKNSDGYQCSGMCGWVLHVTATADTISEARKKVYERVSKVRIDGSFYRKDIGLRVENHDIPKLKEWGWI